MTKARRQHPVYENKLRTIIIEGHFAHLRYVGCNCTSGSSPWQPCRSGRRGPSSRESRLRSVGWWSSPRWTAETGPKFTVTFFMSQKQDTGISNNEYRKRSKPWCSVIFLFTKEWFAELKWNKVRLHVTYSSIVCYFILVTSCSILCKCNFEMGHSIDKRIDKCTLFGMLSSHACGRVRMCVRGWVGLYNSMLNVQPSSEYGTVLHQLLPVCH